MSPESVLRSRRDIIWQVPAGSPADGSLWWSAFDPIARTNYRCGEMEAWLFQQFDGRRNLRAIQEESARGSKLPAVSLPELAGLARVLLARGLVHCVESFSSSDSTAQTHPTGGGSGWLRAIHSSVSWRLRGFDPQRWLAWLAPHTDWLFSGLALKVWMSLASLVALLVVADFTRLADQASLWQWLMRPSTGTSLFVVFIMTRAAHELGHALTLTRYGGRCPDIGLIFVLGAPCVYCDVTESWRLTSPRRRAAVAAGGMYVELVIATVAASLWLATVPGSVNTLALQTMLVCSISTLLINANPLMRFDGYYILSDCLNEPNLRAKADACLLAIVKRWILGPAPSEHRRRGMSRMRFWGMAAFSLAGVAYRLSLSAMMATVVVTLYSAWHLTWLGRFIAAVLLFSWWVIPTMKFMRNLFASAGGWKRRLRLAVVSAWSVLMIWAVPLPCREYVTGWIQPQRMQGLYAPSSARLDRVLQHSGDSAEAGDAIFELCQDELRLRAIETAHAAEKAQARLVSLERQRYYVQDVDLSALETAAAAARGQAEHARQAVERQVVRCPFPGRLISLPADRLRDIDNRPLSHGNKLWLDDAQVGRQVPAGTMLGAVCSDQLWAVLPLDDAQLQSISAGKSVKLHIPAVGDRVFSARVGAVVRLEQLDSVARLVAENAELNEGGTPAADRPTAARKASAGYAAIVELPDCRAHINAEVRAVVAVEPKTLAMHLGEWFRANTRWLTN